MKIGPVKLINSSSRQVQPSSPILLTPSAVPAMDPIAANPLLDYPVTFEDHYQMNGNHYQVANPVGHVIDTPPSYYASGDGSNTSMESYPHNPCDTYTPYCDYSYDYSAPMDAASSGYYSADYSLIGDQQQQPSVPAHSAHPGTPAQPLVYDNYPTDNLEKYQAAFVSALEGPPAPNVVHDVAPMSEYPPAYQYDTHYGAGVSSEWQNGQNHTYYSSDMYEQPATADSANYCLTTTCVFAAPPQDVSMAEFDPYDVRIDQYPSSAL